MYSSYSFLTLALDVVSGQHYALATLYPWGKDPQYPLYRRLGGLHSQWTQRSEEKSNAERWDPGRPVHIQALYWLSYSGYLQHTGLFLLFELAGPLCSGAVIITGGNWNTLWRACPSDTLSTANPTQTALGMNPRLPWWKVSNLTVTAVAKPKLLWHFIKGALINTALHDIIMLLGISWRWPNMTKTSLLAC